MGISYHTCAQCQLMHAKLDLFLGETGGFMGLLLGASALTLPEILDLVLYKMISKVFVTWPSRTQISTSFWDTLAYGIDIHHPHPTHPINKNTIKIKIVGLHGGVMANVMVWFQGNIMYNKYIYVEAVETCCVRNWEWWFAKDMHRIVMRWGIWKDTGQREKRGCVSKKLS